MITDTPQRDFHDVIKQKQWDEALDRIKEGKLPEISTVKHGFLPIHLACLRRNVPLPVIEALVDAEPDSLKVRSSTKDMAFPIHLAAGCGASLQVVQLLVKAFPDSIYAVNANGLLPLHSACWSTHVCFRVVSFLIESFPGGLHVSTNTCENIPLHAAAYTNAPTDVIRLLVRFNSEGLFVANASGKTPRMVAEDKGHDRVVQVLWEEEAKNGRIEYSDTHMKEVEMGRLRIRDDEIISTALNISSGRTITRSDPEFEPNMKGLLVPELTLSEVSLEPDMSLMREDGSVNSDINRMCDMVTPISSPESSQDGIDSSGNHENASRNNRKTNTTNVSTSDLSDAIPFGSSPKRTRFVHLHSRQSISPLGRSTTNIVIDQLVGYQVAQMKNATVSTGDTFCTFGDNTSLITTNTGVDTHRSRRANSFILELQQSEEFWGIQLDSSKTRPSVIERICHLEIRVFGKLSNGPLLKRHKDLYYFGSDGESYAEWIDQLEEIFLGSAYTSDENSNAVTRIEGLEALFFGEVKTSDIPGRLTQLDAISRFG